MVNPFCARSVMESPVISSPLNTILPEVGLEIPIKMRISVDFPLPFGPVMTLIALSSKVRLTSFNIFCFFPLASSLTE